MLEIRTSYAETDEILNRLKDYNDHYQPKVNYKPVVFYAEEADVFLGGAGGLCRMGYV